MQILEEAVCLLTPVSLSTPATSIHSTPATAFAVFRYGQILVSFFWNAECVGRGLLQIQKGRRVDAACRSTEYDYGFWNVFVPQANNN